MASKRHLSPSDILGIIESVARRYPRAWQLAHSNQPERHDFAILVARDLFTASGGTAGGNWRRAEIGDFSMDGLSIENQADGLYYFADYIVGGGGPNPRIAYSGHPFQDVSLLRDGAGHYAPQGFVNPFGVPGSYPPLVTHGDYGTVPVDPVGVGTKTPIVPYAGDEYYIREMGEPMEADYTEGRQTMNGRSAAWWGRVFHDAFIGDHTGKKLTPAESMKKHRNEWRAALGLPPVR